LRVLARRQRTSQGKAPRPRAAPFQRRLVIMAKAPIAGASKTRLASDVGVAHAIRFARQATAALVARVGRDPRWQTCIAVTPDRWAEAGPWPPGVAIKGQGRGDLGQRMQRLFDQAAPGPLMIVGTDIPELTPCHIAAAFRALGKHQAVFGPAVDGGYWLVGLRRRPRRLTPFRAVRWSSAAALADTLANLAPVSSALVVTLSDVDAADAFRRLAHTFGRRVMPRA
jgi:rSAM/selenodomain-associated transferase 1